MNADELKVVLEKHRKWLNNEDGGERASFSCTDLCGADFRGTDLRGADFRGTDLRGADFSGADLRGANFRGADLRDAILRGAKLSVIHTDIWTIYIHPDTVRIGCKHFTHEGWLSFSDEEIAAMESRALDWWRVWKPVVAATIEVIKNQK